MRLWEINIIDNENGIYFYVDLINTLPFFSHQTLLHIAHEIVIFFLFSVPIIVCSVSVTFEDGNVVVWTTRNRKDSDCKHSCSRMWSEINNRKSTYVKLRGLELEKNGNLGKHMKWTFYLKHTYYYLLLLLIFPPFLTSLCI